jgi:exonuclease 1
MGIQGLLPFLRKYAQSKNVKEFRGKTVGVDAMCWMHKGAFACSQDLVTGQDTDKFVMYFLKMCEVLRYNEIKPIIVFDGDKLPAKAKEDAIRTEAREQAKKEALELLERKRKGEQIDDRQLSAKCQGAIKITSSMISRLQSALRELSIFFLVAPFEADAQLAYMCRIGWVHAVISEDSDLLAYGCPNTFFKMNLNGDGDHIALPCLQPPTLDTSSPNASSLSKEQSDNVESPKTDQKESAEVVVDSADEQDQENADPNLQKPKVNAKKGRGKARGGGRGKHNKASPEGKKHDKDPDVSEIDKWAAEKFVELCVFCGSDYKEQDVHIKGFGPKTAFKLLSKFADAECLIKWMAEDERWKNSFPCKAEEYMKRFNAVLAVFWHHVVFDPRRGECVSIATSFPHTEALRSRLEAPNFMTSKEEASRIARGEIDPRSKLPRILASNFHYFDNAAVYFIE